MTKERLDEIERWIAALDEEMTPEMSGTYPFIIWREDAKSLIAASRELAAIREGAGLTLEHRRSLEETAEWLGDDGMEKAPAAIFAALVAHDSLAAEIDRLKVQLAKTMKSENRRLEEAERKFRDELAEYEQENEGDPLTPSEVARIATVHYGDVRLDEQLAAKEHCQPATERPDKPTPDWYLYDNFPRWFDGEKLVFPNGVRMTVPPEKLTGPLVVASRPRLIESGPLPEGHYPKRLRIGDVLHPNHLILAIDDRASGVMHADSTEGWTINDVQMTLAQIIEDEDGGPSWSVYDYGPLPQKGGS